ncbi:hypothetical protein OAO01_07240, partial [Oligoflexia bacterium]|nr:hypothetical protein [Oligoflexia bacterium]
MNSGKFVCINNNYEDLGDQGAEFFGRFFIAMIWNAARKRTKLAESEKRPVYVFIDEAHYVIARDPKIATILQQCRAQKIAIVFAHQELQQIKSDDVRSALTNCAIKFANSTGDAHELAARFDASPEFLKAQKRGSFACYVRDKTETGISLSVPLVDLVLYDTLTPDEVQELVAASRAAYGQYERPPEQVASDKDSSLYWEITISPHLARAGGRRQIRTPRGAIEFMVPTNTIDGSKLRLRGCGMLMPDQSWGDLILTLKVPPMPRTGSPALLPVEDPREWG